MTNAKHTPTPWQVEHFNAEAIILAKQERIAVEVSDYNALHIIRCVNAHDELVAALREVVDTVDRGIVTHEVLIARKFRALLAKLDNERE